MQDRTVAFLANDQRMEAAACAEKAAAFFREAGYQTFFLSEKEPDRCGMIITFGGDGTLLAGAAYAMRMGCPLLGINLGTVGFLTEGDPARQDAILHRVLEGRYTLEERDLLRVSVEGDSSEYLALNDAVITRGGFARLIQVETRINQEHWGTFIADGGIAATPTGSTGYSLSAGGPVVAPGVKGMIITPVCAHSMQHCPCIVPQDAVICFHLRAQRDQMAELQIDGRNLRTLRAGERVTVTGASEKLKLVRMGDYQFFTLLETKLNEWSGEREGD